MSTMKLLILLTGVPITAYCVWKKWSTMRIVGALCVVAVIEATIGYALFGSAIFESKSHIEVTEQMAFERDIVSFIHAYQADEGNEAKQTLGANAFDNYTLAYIIDKGHMFKDWKGTVDRVSMSDITKNVGVKIKSKINEKIAISYETPSSFLSDMTTTVFLQTQNPELMNQKKFSTMVPLDSPLGQKILNLKIGQEITFSFIPLPRLTLSEDNSKFTALAWQELSLTERGKMSEPEFQILITDVK